MIETAIIISLASLGFRAITDKGMILYFLRKPFENANPTVQYIAKPFLLCSTCMASVHTVLWFYLLNVNGTIQELFCLMLMVAFINTLLWSIVELIKKHK